MVVQSVKCLLHKHEVLSMFPALPVVVVVFFLAGLYSFLVTSLVSGQSLQIINITL